MEIEKRVEIAYQLRKEGYNCAQAVVMAYLDCLDGLTKEQVMKMAAVFGGGFGGQRELCGAVSGAGMVLGLVFGKEESDPKHKKYMNEMIGSFYETYTNHHGSAVCGELLGLRETTKILKKKPCNVYIEDAIRILEEYVCTINV